VASGVGGGYASKEGGPTRFGYTLDPIARAGRPLSLLA